MLIDVEQIITLENNENYFVASIVEYENEKYALLVNVNKDNDSFISRINDDNTITRVEDNKELYSLFNKEIG